MFPARPLNEETLTGVFLLYRLFCAISCH